MSVDMNLVVIGGRLTNDPSPLGDNGNGCRFDIASNRTYRNRDGEKQEDTTFMPITCWGPLSEIVMNRAKKGSAVVVEGRIEVRKFTADDGTPRKYVNIVARDVRFADARPAEASTSAPPRRASASQAKNQQLPDGVDPAAAALLAQLLGNKQ